MTDWRAAEQIGVPFVARVRTPGVLPEEGAVAYLPDLTGLSSLVDEMLGGGQP